MFSILKMAARRSAVALILCTALTGCHESAFESDSLSREDCVRLRAHAAAQQVATAPTVAGSAADVETELRKHEKNVVQALGEEFIADCQSTRTRAYLDCALEASSAAGPTGCDD